MIIAITTIRNSGVGELVAAGLGGQAGEETHEDATSLRCVGTGRSEGSGGRAGRRPHVEGLQLQHVGEDLGHGAVQRHRDLLLHLARVVERARQRRQLQRLDAVLGSDLADVQRHLVDALGDDDGAWPDPRRTSAPRRNARD
jgi:hypothetical protein